MPGIFPCKSHKIKNNINIWSCLLFHSCFLRISRNYLPHWGKMQEALFVPLSFYGVWRSEDALFSALYDSNIWDVLKILSERTLQNMTKLTWEGRVKPDFLGEKNHFSNFLGCCFVGFFFPCLLLYMVTHYIELLESKYLFAGENTSIWKGYSCTWRSLILEHRLAISEMKI